MIYETNTKIDLTRKNNTFTAFFVLGVFTNLDIDELKNALSPQELREYNTHKYKKRRDEYNFGRYIAKKSVTHFYKEAIPNQMSIGRGVFHQPVLYCPNNSKNIQVSLSHVNNIAVSIAFPEEHPMGVDIEKISETTVEALDAQMLDKEMEVIESVQIPKNTGLTMLWTIKESLSKVLKTGLTVPLSVYSVKKMEEVEGGYLSEFDHFIQYKTFSWVIDRYVCSICLPKNTSFILDMNKINALPTRNKRY